MEFYAVAFWKLFYLCIIFIHTQHAAQVYNKFVCERNENDRDRYMAIDAILIPMSKINDIPLSVRPFLSSAYDSDYSIKI